MPVPVDEKCFLNLTTSLCDEQAIDNIRHFFSDTVPAAVLVGSDGIDDCFAGAEKLYGFYRVILSSFKEKDEETAKTELIDYLPRLSEKGSGDDISIGMVADKEVLQGLGFEMPKQEMTAAETQETGAEIMQEKKDREMRLAAIKNLTDEKLLTEIINGGDEYICEWEEYSGLGSPWTDPHDCLETHTLDLRDVARERLEELQRGL